MFDDGFTDRLCCSDQWLQMHDQAGARIDLDDRTALSFERFCDVFRNQIDACDVESNGLRSEHARRCHVRMHASRCVDREVSVVAYQYALIRRWYGFWIESLARQQRASDVVDEQWRKRLRCVVA